MATVSYPYDDTGTRPSNLVVNELQVLTKLNDDPYRYLIPDFAPFYKDNFRLIGKDALGGDVTLHEFIDYNFNLKYIGATRANGKIIFGGVTVMNQLIQGEVRVTYQCLGGKYSADRNYVVGVIAENNYNPRRVAWDQVTSIQEYFPPSPHPQDLDTFTGYRDLMDKFDDLIQAVASADPLRNTVYKHILDLNDPHETLRLIKNIEQDRMQPSLINYLANY